MSMALGDEWEIETAVVAEDEWSHGEARGVCIYSGARPRVEVKDRPNDADLATTLVHELAHARLHNGVREEDERAKREVEAEAVAYVVGRHFGLDTSGSAFYLAAWGDEDAETLQERLGRISSNAQEIIRSLRE